MVALPWIAVVGFKLWLVDGQRLTAYGSLTIDDQWFVERASWVTAGRWMGPFDGHTLIKQPGYPMFIAAVHALRLPLLLAHQLVYVLSICVVMVALRSLWASRRRRLAAFAMLLFNPMTMNTAVSARVDRAGIYPALTLVLVACLVAVVSTCDRPRWATAVWAVAASAALGAVWLVREEWLLVAPAVGAAMVLAIVRLSRRPDNRRRRLVTAVGVACIPVSVVVGTFWLRHVNESRYGLGVTNVEQTSMSVGLGSMFRVAPVTTFAQFPITVETRSRLYSASVTFAGLRSEIENGVGAPFSSIRPDGVGDLGGQVFQWVVLDAIESTGKDSSAAELDATFRSIAAELDEACSAGRLRCGAPHSGITPAWRWGRLPGLVGRSMTGLRRTVDLGAFSALSPAGDGTEADRQLFSRMTNEPLAPATQGFLDRQRVHLIGALRWLYRVLIVVAFGAGAGKAVSQWRVRRRPSLEVVTPAVVGGLVVAVRVVGLAYLDLTAFPAFSPTYLASAYAVVLVLGAGALFARRQAVVAF